jgi:hypothetical protein
MKHQEELKAVLIVVCFFALSILVFLFILKWDDIVDYCRRKVRKPETMVCFFRHVLLLTFPSRSSFSVVGASNETGQTAFTVTAI